MIYKIYIITDNTNGNCYIGQTIQKLKQRIWKHISDFKAGNNCSSKLILKNNDWKYELIEETDDRTREKYWIQNSPNSINTRRFEGRNKENAKYYNKKRKDKNREQIRIDDRKKYEWYKSWGGRGTGLRCWNNNSLLRISPDVFN